jgi:hypothetical protein
MVLSRRALFFNLGPAILLPVPDPLLVALERFPGRTLAAAVELAQNAPDVVLVIAHPGAVRDEITHPSCGPQAAGIAARLGPALERALEVTQLRRVELCWTAGASRLAQAAQP